MHKNPKRLQTILYELCQQTEERLAENEQNSEDESSSE